MKMIKKGFLILSCLCLFLLLGFSVSAYEQGWYVVVNDVSCVYHVCMLSHPDCYLTLEECESAVGPAQDAGVGEWVMIGYTCEPIKCSLKFSDCYLTEEDCVKDFPEDIDLYGYYLLHDGVECVSADCLLTESNCYFSLSECIADLPSGSQIGNYMVDNGECVGTVCNLGNSNCYVLFNDCEYALEGGIPDVPGGNGGGDEGCDPQGEDLNGDCQGAYVWVDSNACVAHVCLIAHPDCYETKGACDARVEGGDEQGYYVVVDDCKCVYKSCLLSHPTCYAQKDECKESLPGDCEGGVGDGGCVGFPEQPDYASACEAMSCSSSKEDCFEDCGKCQEAFKDCQKVFEGDERCGGSVIDYKIILLIIIGVIFVGVGGYAYIRKHVPALGFMGGDMYAGLFGLVIIAGVLLYFFAKPVFDSVFGFLGI